MNCTSCGNEIFDSASRFCSNCGAAVAGESRVQTAANDPTGGADGDAVINITESTLANRRMSMLIGAVQGAGVGLAIGACVVLIWHANAGDWKVTDLNTLRISEVDGAASGFVYGGVIGLIVGGVRSRALGKSSALWRRLRIVLAVALTCLIAVASRTGLLIDHRYQREKSSVVSNVAAMPIASAATTSNMTYDLSIYDKVQPGQTISVVEATMKSPPTSSTTLLGKPVYIWGDEVPNGIDVTFDNGIVVGKRLLTADDCIDLESGHHAAHDNVRYSFGRYARIKKSMTLGQVDTIMGNKGKYVAPLLGDAEYDWDNDDGFSRAMVILVNGRVREKSAINLR